MPTDFTESVGCLISTEMLEEIEKLRKKRLCSKSVVIRQLIQAGLEKEAENE